MWILAFILLSIALHVDMCWTCYWTFVKFAADNFKFMELELQFHDDNTSCSSSLSTSISEDIDDLRLGAEGTYVGSNTYIFTVHV